MLQLVTKHRQ
jgi:hypothetical protein